VSCLTPRSQGKASQIIQRTAHELDGLAHTHLRNIQENV
jgi:hypothetical protein